MKRLAILALGTLMLGLPGVAPVAIAQSASEAATALTEVTFFVPDMTCALCPVTVTAAMSGVKGVQSVEVDFPARCIATGGLAALIATETRTIEATDELLTLKGLKILYHRNVG